VPPSSQVATRVHELPPSATLRFVTGTGERRAYAGSIEGPYVLLQHVQDYLTEGFYPPIDSFTQPNMLGRIITPMESVRVWALAQTDSAEAETNRATGSVNTEGVDQLPRR
jgi:hypothetical protein